MARNGSRNGPPETNGGLDAFECISAMQKCVRRSDERLCMELALELAASSKSYAKMVTNRLEIISHEDIGLAAPDVVVLVATCCEQANRFGFDPNKPGKWSLPVSTAIRALCRAPKSREGDHFVVVCNSQRTHGGWVPEIPDWALDMHTQRGRQNGRGLDHFLEEGAKLVNPDGSEPEPDQYAEEAEQWFKVKHGQLSLEDLSE